MMKIGISTTTIEPALTGGHIDGIGVYTNALVTGLPAFGCEVRGMSFPPFPSQRGLAPFVAGEAFSHSFIVSSLRDILSPGFVRYRPEVDLFHATDYRIVRMECPVVVTLHDAIPLKYPQWCRPRLRTLKNWVQKNAARNADHVVALSHHAVAELVEYFDVDPDKISVVPCGAHETWAQAPDPEEVAAALARHGLKPGYFLFVGTLQPRKNVERILDAYLSLPQNLRRQRQLVIVGRAGWQCEQLVRKLKAAMQNGEPVVWLNRIEGDYQLRLLYAGAGIFVFPSLYEGFGIPVVEAFASGVPVLTSNTTSLPEVSAGAALEIDPLNTGEIAHGMQQLAESDALRERCIAAGRLRARELTWANSVERMAAVYRTVLQS